MYIYIFFFKRSPIQLLIVTNVIALDDQLQTTSSSLAKITDEVKVLFPIIVVSRKIKRIVNVLIYHILI